MTYVRRHRWLRPAVRLIAILFAANAVLAIVLFSLDDMTAVEMLLVSIASAVCSGLLWEAIE